MGFWITLEDESGSPMQVESHTEGGTYVLGGTSDAERDVTYNYSQFWQQALGEKPDGPHADLYGLGPWLHDKTGAETLDLLKRGVAVLGADPSDDYWEATEGNAGYVLEGLRRWAEQHPDGRWNVHGG